MRDHVMPTDITPTVFVMTHPMKPPGEEQRRLGVACVTADDFRWQKAHIKSSSLLRTPEDHQALEGIRYCLLEVICQAQRTGGRIERQLASTQRCHRGFTPSHQPDWRE